MRALPRCGLMPCRYVKIIHRIKPEAETAQRRMSTICGKSRSNGFSVLSAFVAAHDLPTNFTPQCASLTYLFCGASGLLSGSYPAAFMQLRKTKRNLICDGHPLVGAMCPFVAHIALSCANFSSLTGSFLCSHRYLLAPRKYRIELRYF